MTTPCPRPALIEPLEERVAPAAVLYMSVDSDPNGLYQIDPTTGAATRIGATGVNTDTVGLTETTNPYVLLGSDPFGLVQINADGSGRTLIGNVVIEGLAMDTGTGILYASVGGSFFTVDPATGGNTGALASPGGDVEGLAYNGAGKIFAVDSTGDLLRSYDIAGNVWTTVGPLGMDVDNVGLAYDRAADVLYLKGDQDTNLYRINPATAAVSLVGDTGIAGGGGLALIDNGLKIVNSKTATYTDGNGDLVTVKITQGTLTASNFLLVPAPHGGAELWRLDLSAAGFKDSNVTITAKKTAAGGDGLAHVGYLNGGAHDLGTVTIPGDLATIDAGDDDHKKPAIAALTVGSMGVIDLSKNLGLDQRSDFAGDLGKVTVRGDFVEKEFVISRNLGTFTVGGSLRGGDATNSGRVTVLGTIQSASIGGSVIGGDGTSSGVINAVMAFGSVKVAGALMGGDGPFSANLSSSSGMLGAVTIGQSVIGGVGPSSGRVMGASVGSVTIRGDVVGGDGYGTGAVESNGTLGSVTIGGSVIGGDGEFSGEVYSGGELGRVKITGSVLGGDGSQSGIVLTFGAGVKSVTIGGSILGAMGPKSGAVEVGRLDAVSVGHDVHGGDGVDSGRISSTTTIGTVKIGRSLIGGDGARSGGIVATGAAKSVTIGDSMLGDFGPDSGGITVAKLDALTIGSDVRGGDGQDSGKVTVTGGGSLGPVKIGGSLIGGEGGASGHLVAGSMHSVKVGRSIVGGDGSFSGSIISDGTLGALTVGGSVLGGEGVSSANISGNNSVAGQSGPISVAGDVIGKAAASSLIFSAAGGWKAVTIGGSLLGGEAAFSGGILAAQNLGKVTIKGSVTGVEGSDVFIRAGGLLIVDPGATKNVALESLTIGGSVAHTQVLVGFGLNNVAALGGVQLGAVSVGGNWSQSSIAVGHTAGTDMDYGTDDDTLIFAGTNIVASIASITIKGAITGTYGGTDHYGFVAAQIGKFTAAGRTVPLVAATSGQVFEVGFFTGDVTVREI